MTTDTGIMGTPSRTNWFPWGEITGFPEMAASEPGLREVEEVQQNRKEWDKA